MLSPKNITPKALAENDFVVNLGMPFTTLNNDTFQALFNYASIGILIANDSGVIQMANKYIEHQFGYDEGELIGKKVEILIPPRYAHNHEKHRSKFSANPHSRPMGLGMELSGIKKDGFEFPVEVSLGHYKIDNDSYSLAFINDITQRKETEHAIIQLNAHLEEKVKEGSQSLAITVDQLGQQMRETERKDAELERVNTFLNNIWNHAGAIIFVCDVNGVMQFFNPAAEKAFGYQSNEVLNKMQLVHFHAKAELIKKAEELSVIANKTIAPDFSVFATSVDMNMGNNQEWYYVRKDGTKFYASLNITPLKDPHNNISNYLGVAIDISEKKKAETELLSALEKEKELNELKSRFVSMASHEFRTPLSAVLSSTYLLSRYNKEEEQPQREKHIQRIVASVTSLTEILNDFLSVGKIEEGEIHVNFRMYDISEQMNDVLQDVQHLLKKGQNINYVHTGNSSSVYLDQSMMKHIVTNLLSNAIKFSNEGSVVQLDTEIKGKKIIVCVKDNGIGIPDEDKQDLFKRFFRSSNVTNIQGTGLGLHIVHKYAELMGGNIDLESKIGEGTKITIIFNNKKNAEDPNN
jgi:PAS domain S-box-containing protein